MVYRTVAAPSATAEPSHAVRDEPLRPDDCLGYGHRRGQVQPDEIDRWWEKASLPSCTPRTTVTILEKKSTSFVIKGKEKAEVAMPTTTTDQAAARMSVSGASYTSIGEDTDWTNFSPPSALREAGNVESEILVGLLDESVNNVVTRNQRRRKRAGESEEDGAGRGENDGARIGITASSSPLASPPPSSGPPTPDHKTPSRSDSTPSTSTGGLTPTSSAAESTYVSALSRLERRIGKLLQWGLCGVDRGEGPVSLPRLLNLQSSSDSSGESVECVACMDVFSPKKLVKSPCHSYCSPCFAQLIRLSMQDEQHFPPKCCLNEIPVATIQKNLPSRMRREYRGRLEELSIPVSQRIYCSDANCDHWVRPKKINPELREGRCPRGHATCVICRGRAHGKLDCPQDRDMVLTEALAADQGWHRCDKCRAIVEHVSNCRHMTCRCGHQFCYVCGARWCTCECKNEQVEYIKNTTEHRRAERLRREAREEAELQHALRQVKEYEREEARREDMRRVARELLEEEDRRREFAGRRCREIARREEIELRYGELRGELAAVHRRQQALAKERIDAEAAELQVEGTLRLGRLRRELAAADADADVDVRLRDMESVFTSEDAIRMIEDTRREFRYEQEVRKSWEEKNERAIRAAGAKAGAATAKTGPAQGGEEGKEQEDEQEQENPPHLVDVDAVVELAMAPLRKRLAADRAAWLARRDGALASTRAAADRERAGLMQARHRRIREAERKLDERKDALQRKREAEAVWFRVVERERQRMLSGMERDERGDRGIVPDFADDDGDEVGTAA